MAATAQQANNVAIVQTFTKRAKEAALATGATQEVAKAAATAAAADAETAFEENAMHE